MKKGAKKTSEPQAKKTSPRSAVLLCPGCGREHSAASVEDEQGFARCVDCSSVFLMPRDVAWGGAFRSDAPASDVRVVDGAIEWRYRHARVGLLAAITVGLIGLIVLTALLPTDTDASLRLVLQIPPAGGALFAGYFMLLSFVEWISIAVVGGRLVVRARPLAMPRVAASFDVKKIHDVYVDKTVERGRTHFDVMLCLDSGTSRVARLDDVERALAVAGAARDALSLEVGPSKHLLDVMTRARVLTELLAKQLAEGTRLTDKG